MTDLDKQAREQFEAWHCEKFKTYGMTGAPTRDMHNGIRAEKYGPPAQQERWELWQAAYAAALTTAPEGFVLVPVDCSDAMREAWDGSPLTEDDDADFHEAYRRMLAAAKEVGNG